MARDRRQEREPTKKQIATSRREKHQQKRIRIALGIVGALILGIGLVALVDQLVIQPSRPVAIVYGERIRTDEYQRRVLYERLQLDTLLQNIQAQLSQLDPQDPTGGFLAQYYQQIAQQTQQQRLGVDQRTVDDMVEEKLVRRKAAELGITVSEDELNEAVRARIASMSGYLTEKQATDIASTAVAASATAETFTPTPQPTATATLTASLVITATPTATLERPTPAPTPTRHIITQEEFSQDYADYLNRVKEETGLSEAEYRQTVQAGLLANKVYEYFGDQVPKEAEQVNASHIQTDTEEQAKAAVERLDGGEDFALVASEVSTDTFTAENGGELGWFLKEELEERYGTATAEAVFVLEPGKYSQPISSLDGWHIFKVNERQVRSLEDYQLQARQQKAYMDWLREARSAEGVEVLWQPDMAPPDPVLELPANQPLGSLPPGDTQQ